jgi:hypothetical protein
MDRSYGIPRKQTRGISICVDLRKLNNAFLHDPFAYPFYK